MYPFCSSQESLQVRVERKWALQVLLCSRPLGWVVLSPFAPSQWMRLPNTCIPLWATFLGWFIKSNPLSWPRWAQQLGSPNKAPTAGCHLRDLQWMTSQLGLHLQLPDCLQLPDHLWLWLNLSIVSSSRSTATNTHHWVSHAMVRASSHYPLFKSLKWLYVAQTLSWNSACGSGLEVPVGLHLSLSSDWICSCLCQRHSLMESRIFLADPLLHLSIIRVFAKWLL